ncbi:MAG: hypothetical protein ACYC8T_24835 [Myxococcaceae bacterium]
MRAGRFYSVVAERALASGRPLHEELRSAAALLGGMPPPVVRAVDFALTGKLAEALGALAPLGFDPLLAEAAALRPEAATEVSQALSRLPRSSDLLYPLIAPVVYLTGVVLFEAGAALLLWAKVLPALGQLAAPAGGLLWVAVVAGWSALAVALAAIAALPVLPRLESGRRLLNGPLASARVCAAFGPLAAAGVPSATAFELAGRYAPGLADALSRSPNAAVDWAELAAHFAERGQARIARLTLVVKGAGTLVAVLLAALILASVYLSLPALSAAGGAS